MESWQIFIGAIPVIMLFVTFYEKISKSNTFDKEAYEKVFFPLHEILKECNPQSDDDFEKLNDSIKTIINDNTQIAGDPIRHIFKTYIEAEKEKRKSKFIKLRKYNERHYDLLCVKLGLPSNHSYLNYIAELFGILIIVFVIVYVPLYILQIILT